jgi:hypothetical protein
MGEPLQPHMVDVPKVEAQNVPKVEASVVFKESKV